MRKRIITLSVIGIAILTVLILLSVLVIRFLLNCEDEEFIKAFWTSVIIDTFLTLIPYVFGLIRTILVHLNEIREYEYSHKYKNIRIRLSFAYLIRIKINNRYLLVKSGHKREIFGPVGGVYHIEHIDYVYNKLGFVRDETPGDSEDVRGTILGKNIRKFIKWFNKKENREIEPNREFNEELIVSSIVPAELFSNNSFKFIKTSYRGIGYDSFYKKNELCRFDIFELVLNKEQESFFQTMKTNKLIKLVTREDIETGGINKDNDKRIIGDQTIFILED